MHLCLLFNLHASRKKSDQILLFSLLDEEKEEEET